MSSLMVLYMSDSLFQPGHIEHVAGFRTFRLLIETLTGPLSKQSLAIMVFALYSGFVYVTPILGGIVGDRLIGRWRTVVIGALLLAAGHLAMASDSTFLVALALLVAGCGCLKGNISAQVGALYAPEDGAGKTRGFAIFSAWIVAGAFLGPLVCGGIAQYFGWHAGFGAAGVLMLVGLATYLYGRDCLPVDAPRTQSRSRRSWSSEDRRAATVVVVVIGITVCQTVVLDQLDSVGLIWIRDTVDLATPFGTVPPAWFNSIGAFSQIIALPPLLALWRWQAARGSEPGDVEKIGIGATITAVSILFLAIASVSTQGEKVGLIWPLLAYGGYGVAFIYCWPTLLALVSRRSPTGASASMLGVAFFSLFCGSLIAGWIGTYYERMNQTEFWLLHVGIASLGATLALLCRTPVNRLACANDASVHG
jgi:proton-dependent oligopeptide transporter, POT family